MDRMDKFKFINFRTQFEFDFLHIIIGRAKDDEDHKVCPHIYMGGNFFKEV
jgi:hypothetical protein